MKTNQFLRANAAKTVSLLTILALAIGGFLVFGAKTEARPMVAPTVGSVIFNEYAADNDAAGNDFFELLVITDNLDLRGLRVSDNELLGGVLNNGESVFVFGTDAYLASVPKGTTIAVYTAATGVTTDTTTNPAGGDWKMVLAPGTGVTVSDDGLGGGINPGLSTSGEALYLYLPGADGTSAGTDNIYLDFVSFEADGGDAPTGLTDLNLPSVADNAYYRGSTAAGNDTAGNWTTYDFPPSAPNVPTPGDANPSQDLSNLRTVAAGAPTITENTASSFINLPAASAGFVSGVNNDPTDPARTLGIDFTIADPDTQIGSLTVTATSNNQTVVPNANLNLTGSGANRNLKITPAAIGYATVSVTVGDGTSSATYTVNYAASAASTAPTATVFHTGKSDASTAIAIDANYMLIGDDEDQALRLYDRRSSGLPLNSFDYTSMLGLTDSSGGVLREVDIEASAQIGNRIYWLGSHSNAASGNLRPNRYRLFATDLTAAGAASTLSYVGRYDNLRTDLINWDVNNTHGLGANYFGLQASAAAGVIPEQADGGGFNIEGLTIAPDGTTGYIAFRAPIAPASSRTKALIVPVTNFTSLVSGNPTNTTATFGAPIQLDLGGRGIREIKKNAANEYLIIAGPAASTGNFRLFVWTGNPASQPVLRNADLSGLNPEGIVEVPSSVRGSGTVVQLLSDSGDNVYYNDGTIAKELPNPEFKKFRSDLVTVTLAPTAAVSTVSGKVLFSENSNKPVFRASVTITDPANGERQTVKTDRAGNFTFNEVASGATYIIEANYPLTSFAPQIVNVNENVSGLTFYSRP